MVELHADVLKEDGTCSFNKGDFVETIAKYEEAIQAGFSEKWKLYGNMGKCFMKLESLMRLSQSTTWL